MTDEIHKALTARVARPTSDRQTRWTAYPIERIDDDGQAVVMQIGSINVNAIAVSEVLQAWFGDYGHVTLCTC